LAFHFSETAEKFRRTPFDFYETAFRQNKTPKEFAQSAEEFFLSPFYFQDCKNLICLSVKERRNVIFGYGKMPYLCSAV